MACKRCGEKMGWCDLPQCPRRNAGAEPAWKKNGRAGPFDWWVGCRVHGAEYVAGCLPCVTAEKLNDDLRQRLEQDGAQAPKRVAVTPAPDDEVTQEGIKWLNSL